MRYPSMVMSVLTAVPLATLSLTVTLALSGTVVQAEEMFNPPRSLQEVPNPGRIIISPPPKNRTAEKSAPIDSEQGSSSFTNANFLPEPELPTHSQTAAAPIRPGIPGVYTLADLGYGLPKLVSNLDADPTIDSLASALGGVVSVGVRSTTVRCNLPIEAMPVTLDLMVQALSRASCLAPRAK